MQKDRDVEIVNIMIGIFCKKKQRGYSLVDRMSA